MIHILIAKRQLPELDDYRVTSLAKLKTILDLAVEHDITNVMTTGDFFDKYEVSYAYPK